MMIRRKRLFSEKGMLRSCERKTTRQHSYRGHDELNDEKRRVNQQELKTPGRERRENKTGGT